MVTDTNSFVSRPTSILLCEYDKLRLDLYILTGRSTEVLVSEGVECIDSLTVKGKRCDYAAGHLQICHNRADKKSGHH